MEEENTISNELRKRTFAFLNNNNIEMPVEVQNALNDVFDENDFTSDEDDVVNIYFKEDLEDFLTDTQIMIKINTQVSGGNSSGFIIDKYSYYGVLNTDHAYSEDIALYDGEKNIDQIYYQEPIKLNSIEDPEDFCIVVLVEHDFSMGEYSVVPKLYMYIPTSGEKII